jgi:crotonobetainyl-CoA:carnitine CoA-transferase CaiB-like acyl-CoA transferase
VARAPALPLASLRVIDLSQGVAGPFCAMVLGDLGADVIKVEKPGAGDLSRGWGPPFASPGNSAYFLSVNRNKRSIALDLKSAAGKNALRKLVARSDVLVENFRPGTLARLGFDAKALQRLRPGLIHSSVTGYGPTGPSRDDPSFDFAIQARAGLMSLTGTPGEPMRTPVALFDLVAGLYGVIGILLELRRRDGGQATRPVEVSLLDTAMSLLGYWITGYSLTHEPPQPTGAAHPLIVPYQLMRTQDSYVALAAGTDLQFARLCHVLRRADLGRDPRFRTNDDRVRHRRALLAILEPLFRRRPAAKLVKELNAAGVPCGAYRTIPDVIRDPQVRHTGILEEMITPGGPPVVVGGLPLGRQRRGSVVHRPAPGLGVDSAQVERELGLPAKRAGRRSTDRSRKGAPAK